MQSDAPDVFKLYTKEIIPGGCRQTDPATGECEEFSCIMCHGGQPGTCDDYPKAQELLQKAQVMLQETGFYLERLEEIVKEEGSGQLSIIYSHDQWKATLKKADGTILKAAAHKLYEVIMNLMSEHTKERESKIKQILYKKIEALTKSCTNTKNKDNE